MPAVGHLVGIPVVVNIEKMAEGPVGYQLKSGPFGPLGVFDFCPAFE
jgi:hypothetical protein